MTGINRGGNLPASSGATPIAAQALAWASRPAASTHAGQIIRITDVSAGQSGNGGGALFISNGTRWKPLFDVTIDAIDTANVGAANQTEQQLAPNHVLLPAGLIADTDRIFVDLTASKNGTGDSCVLRLRFGPTGTTADPVLVVLSSMAGASQSFGTILEFKRISATSIQKLGNGDAATSYMGASTTAFPAPVAVSNMDSNGMYLSITAQMTGGTEIPTLQDMMMKLRASDNT